MGATRFRARASRRRLYPVLRFLPLLALLARGLGSDAAAGESLRSAARGAAESETQGRRGFPAGQSASPPTSLLPRYIGSVAPAPERGPGRAHAGRAATALNWTGTCMLRNGASAALSPAAGSAEPGQTLRIRVKASHCKTLLCSDVYAFATPFRVEVAAFSFARRAATIKMAGLGRDELDYIQRRGVAVFLFPDGASGLLRALLQLPLLLSNSDAGEALLLRFLRERMGASFRLRQKPWIEDLGAGQALQERLSFVASGDLLLTSKFRGPWGLFESLEKWVSGSWMGHMALALRGPCSDTPWTRTGDHNSPYAGAGAQATAGGATRGTGGGPGSGRLGSLGGVARGAQARTRAMLERKEEQSCLWVAESGRLDAAGQPLIQVVTIQEWWQRIAADECQPHAAILPLGAAVRASSWNNSAAWEFLASVEGLPFGFHNFLFSWIDTPSGNFPEPLDSHSMAALVAMWRELRPEFVGRVMEEALNKRLGTSGLEFGEILEECARRGLTFGDLLAVPELDQWHYSDGVSASCVSLAVRVWKAAGLFRLIGDQVNAGEFTIRDAYQLDVFDTDPAHLPEWCTRGRSLGICQLSGKYEVDLPGYSTIKAYAFMNERCPSMPPNYTRPPDC